MTREETVEIFQVVGALFSRADMFTAARPANVVAWHTMLQDLPREIVLLAIQRHATRSQWPPSIYEVRQCAIEAALPDIPAEDEAWGQVMQALTRGAGYRYSSYDPKDDMHPLAYRVACNMGWTSLAESDELAIVRGQFGRMYAAALAAERERQRTPEYIRQQVDALRGSTAARLQGGDNERRALVQGNPI